jgi:spore maturation protein CgeB
LRILIVDTFYEAFLADHYARNPCLERAQYDTQWRSLMDTGFGTADAYSFHLRALGHEAQEIVVNCAPLQAGWAREHGFRPRGRWTPRLRPDESVVLAQAAEFAPDVVYVQNLHFLSRAALRLLRRRGALVVGQIASQRPSPQTLQAFDLILTSLPNFVDDFARLGVPTAYFRIGFDSRVLAKVDAEPRGNDGPVFAGALNRTQHRFGNEVLERAAARVPIDFWGYDVSGWAEDSPVVRRYRGEAWGLEMFRVLRRARVVLNRHIELAAGYANNMRLYEATGVGTLLLTDAGRNLVDLFEPGDEVVVYRDEDDLVEKITYFLEHDDEREAIARAGHERTLSEHTYAHRMKELAGLLQRELSESRS